MTKDQVVKKLLDEGLPPPGWKRQILWLGEGEDGEGDYGVTSLITTHSWVPLEEGEKVVAEVHGGTANAAYFPEGFYDPEKVAEVLRELGLEDEEVLELVVRDPIRGWGEIPEEFKEALEEHPAWEEILAGAERLLLLEILEEEGFLEEGEKDWWVLKGFVWR